MGLKIKNATKMAVTFGSIIVLILIIAVNFQRVNIFNYSEEREENRLAEDSQTAYESGENTNDVEVGNFDFDEKTRLLTSPKLSGNDNNGWQTFRFQITVPKNWTVSKADYEKNNNGYVLSISKDHKYFVEIQYGYPYGPSTCVFPEEKKPKGGYETVDEFETINTNMGVLRLITKYPELDKAEVKIFRVCQQSKYNEWSTATKLDQIVLRVIGQENPVSQTEAVNIIRSIKLTIKPQSSS